MANTSGDLNCTGLLINQNAFRMRLFIRYYYARRGVVYGYTSKQYVSKEKIEATFVRCFACRDRPGIVAGRGDFCTRRRV